MAGRANQSEAGFLECFERRLNGAAGGQGRYVEEPALANPVHMSRIVGGQDIEVCRRLAVDPLGNRGDGLDDCFHSAAFGGGIGRVMLIKIGVEVNDHSESSLSRSRELR